MGKLRIEGSRPEGKAELLLSMRAPVVVFVTARMHAMPESVFEQTGDRDSMTVEHMTVALGTLPRSCIRIRTLRLGCISLAADRADGLR